MYQMNCSSTFNSSSTTVSWMTTYCFNYSEIKTSPNHLSHIQWLLSTTLIKVVAIIHSQLSLNSWIEWDTKTGLEIFKISPIEVIVVASPDQVFVSAPCQPTRTVFAWFYECRVWILNMARRNQQNQQQNHYLQCLIGATQIIPI